MKKMLLASTSTIYGQKYLEYLHEDIKILFSGCEKIIFIPYAQPSGISYLEYTKKAKTKHIMPARLSKFKYSEVLKIAKKTHDAFKCRGVTRADFKFYKGNFYLLEINTQPGMTELSLVPEIAKYKGISFYNLIRWMINDASINR